MNLLIIFKEKWAYLIKKFNYIYKTIKTTDLSYGKFIYYYNLKNIWISKWLIFV